MSPTANTSGCPGRVRSGSTLIRPARSTSAPLASASAPANGEACTPAAQITVRAAMRSVVPSFMLTSTPSASTPVTRAPKRNSTPRSVSERVAARDRLWPNVARGSSPPSTMITRIVRGSKVRKSPRSARERELAHLPRDLDAGRARADDHDGEPLSLLGRVDGDLRDLERAEDAPAQLERVVDRLHPRREQGEFVVPEVRLVGAGRDDQAVVRDLHLVHAQPLGLHHLAVEIEAVDLGQLDLHVLVLAQHVTQRWRDLPGRQDAGGHLVQERLEQVVVAPVDQRDLDVELGEPTARRQTSEPTADHHDAVGHDASISTVMRRCPASMSARCVNACGKFPRCCPVLHVDLLGVEVQRPGEREQLLEQGAGAVDLTDDGQRGHQPERADGEGTLLAGKAVVGGGRRGSATRGRPESARRRSRARWRAPARRRRGGSP